MKMIVGLGNPGPKYELTHHNAGFWVIDNIAEELGVRCTKAEKQALTAQVMYRGEKLLLVKPQSYMNLSGHPVRDLMHFYKIDFADLLVIYDDMDLEPGALRLRRNGSCGGHNGMRSIIEQLGTDNICRIKLGIGRSKGGAIDHVLGRISKAEEQIFSDAVLKAAEAALLWSHDGIQEAMNRYNIKPKKEKKAKEDKAEKAENKPEQPAAETTEKVQE